MYQTTLAVSDWSTAFWIAVSGKEYYARNVPYVLISRLVDQNGMGIASLGLDGSFQGRELGIGWNDGQLFYPGQLCLGSEGDLFVVDRQNNRVQVFAMKR